MSLAGGNVYPAFREALLRAEVDVTTADLWLQLTNGFAYDAAHSSDMDITGAVSTPQPLEVTSVAGGLVQVAPLVFPDIDPAPAITAVVAYVEGGVLAAHISRRADSVPMALVGDGGPLTLTFPTLLKI